MMQKKRVKAQIGRTVMDTRFQVENIEVEPKNAPNVMYIVMDDLGFAQLGCYGSHINTPNIDRLASEGLRYNNFHTTAICSATRASLLTGANHHAVGIGSVCEMTTGCTNAQGYIDRAYGTTAELLKEYGYATYCVGKWHLSVVQASSGPYDQWPLARGFDRYYGFLQAEMDQYHPILIRDNTEVEPPKTPKEGYHLSADLADNAIDYIYQHDLAYPEQPFFLYLAFGAMHAPHQAPREYIDRYKGKFDEGWDVIRQKWFENQKRLGIIPENAELTERNECAPAWDSLTEEQKRLYARFMEVYAGFLEYTDEQIGRVIRYLEEAGKLDDTVIVFLSDNGASGEGGRQGRFNCLSGIDLSSTSEEELKLALDNIDKIGTEYAQNHYPTGWANAGNTPFQWYKTWTHEGGVKDPLIIRYPKLIKDAGGIRGQYHHVSDVTPTILDILGVEKPAFIKGVAQKPFTGTSFKYTLADPTAEDQKHVQYYEIFGNRGIYKDGWKAVTSHTFNETYEEDVWELYHVAEDYSEKHDVAAQYPEKVQELKEEFLIEAARNNVFPMLKGAAHAKPESSLTLFGDKRIVPESVLEYKNIRKPHDLVLPPMKTSLDLASHEIIAEIERDSTEDDGVIFCCGDRFGGTTFFIKDNRLHYVYNRNLLSFYRAESDIEVPAGKSVIKYTFGRRGLSAVVSIFINDQKVGETYVEKFSHQKGPNLTIKADRHIPVCEDYASPFEFKGKIHKLTIHQEADVVDFKKELAKILTTD